MVIISKLSVLAAKATGEYAPSPLAVGIMISVLG
jgi:hypothetical protein